MTATQTPSRRRIAGPSLNTPAASPRAALTAEQGLVADVVGRFAETSFPGDKAVAEWALMLALRSLKSGASLNDSCRYGRRLIDRWARLESCNA